MTNALTRKKRTIDEEIFTPTALPQLTPRQSDGLRVAIAGHSMTIAEMEPMQFYRMCKDAMRGRPKLWEILREQFTDGEVDQVVKWNMVLELLHADVVEVKKGMLVKRYGVKVEVAA